MALILKKKENVVVKVDGQKILVKPIINYQDQIILTEVCVNKFNADGEKKVWTIPACNLIFNLGVLALQTDIEVNGVKKETKDKENILTFDIDADDIEYYTESGIFQKVFDKVENYKSTWENIRYVLQIESLKYCIGEIGKGLPTVEEMQNAIGDMKKAIDDNPQFIEKVVKAKLGNDVVIPESKDLVVNGKVVSKPRKKA